jgi:hypothetical protein
MKFARALLLTLALGGAAALPQSALAGSAQTAP